MASDFIPLVYVGMDNLPGSSEIIRIDSNQPIRWDTTNEHSPPKAIAQMIRGNILRFRWSEWPSGQVSGEVSLQGFTAAFEEAKRRVAAYKTGQ